MDSNFQETMKAIGCTTPFGINLDNICTDETKGQMAMDLLKKLRTETNYEDCLYPCTNLKTRLDKIEFGKVNAATRAKFVFDQYIKVTESYVSYKGKVYLEVVFL